MLSTDKVITSNRNHRISKHDFKWGDCRVTIISGTGNLVTC